MLPWVLVAVAVASWVLTMRDWKKSIERLTAAWRKSNDEIFAAWRAQTDETFAGRYRDLQAASDSPVRHQAAGCDHTKGDCRVRN